MERVTVSDIFARLCIERNLKIFCHWMQLEKLKFVWSDIFACLFVEIKLKIFCHWMQLEKQKFVWSDTFACFCIARNMMWMNSVHWTFADFQALLIIFEEDMRIYMRICEYIWGYEDIYEEDGLINTDNCDILCYHTLLLEVMNSFTPSGISSLAFWYDIDQGPGCVL